MSRRRGPTRKQRRRLRREAERHGHRDLGDYLDVLADRKSTGPARRQSWQARRREDDDG